MRSLTSTHYLLISVLVGASCACAGYLVGVNAGVRKGASAGGWIAKSSLDAEKDMLLIIESALNDGLHEAEIRKLMVGGLEKYLPARMMLSAQPFGQEYDRFPQDQAAIDEAIRRLRANKAVLNYERAEPVATDNPVAAR